MQVLLGVAIGLVLTFAVMAVVVSSVMELIAGVTRLRAHALEQGIARMLDNEPKGGSESPYTQAVLHHPLIRSLSAARASHRPPSYIDAVTFGTAFLGTTLPTTSLVAKLVGSGADLDAQIKGLAAGEPGDTVKAAWNASKKDPTRLVAALLTGTDQGVAPIAALIGTSVEARLAELANAGDPAAGVLAQAWEDAGHDVEALVRQLAQQPSLIARATEGVQGVESALTDITRLNAYLGQSLRDLWRRAGNDVTSFRHEIEDWFDREMARVSGWYSRWSQWIMVSVALVVAIAFNISAVTVGRALWLDPTLRDKAVAAAQQQSASTASTDGQQAPPVTAPPAAASPTSNCAADDTLCEIGLPIGWSATAWPGLDWYLLLHLLGILAVAIAASFGAPFWFDLLNRIVNLRIAGRPPAAAAQQRAPTT